MANADDAIDFVLGNEGGFTINASDSGGATNHGISLRFLREIPEIRLRKYGIFEEPDEITIRDLTEEQARIIYREEFWLTAHFQQIEKQSFCNYVFDCCVLHGIAQGIKILQRATWAALQMHGYLVDDGIMGDKTVSALNTMLKINGMPARLKASLMAERAGFCRLIAEIRKKDGVFLHGWLDRCYHF